MWKFQLPPLGKATAVLPIPTSVCVSAVFSCVQMTVLPDVWIFNMHVDVGVCDCTQGLYGHQKRVCTES